MRGLIVLRPASLHVFATNWERQRMPTRCSASSRASTHSLFDLTFEAPSASTRPSWSRESKMTSSHCTKSSRSSTRRARRFIWAVTGTYHLCLVRSSGHGRSSASWMRTCAVWRTSLARVGRIMLKGRNWRPMGTAFDRSSTHSSCSRTGLPRYVECSLECVMGAVVQRYVFL